MRLIFTNACLTVLLLAFHAMACAQPLVEDALILSTDGSGGSGDSTQTYIVRNILIEGNRKTHPDIILRELSFQINEGYSLESITKHFQRARRQLMNTGLFLDVVVSLKNMSGYDVYVNVKVVEKWYIWPKPFIRTVDKTFQEWWTEKNRSMDRINYGIRLTHNNFTGRNDKLKVNLMNGHTKQVAIQYYGLFLDNQLKWSLNAGVTFGKNREVNYMTRYNKPVPYKDDNQFLRSYMSWFAEVSYRPAIKTRHTFGIGYSSEDIADTIFKLNPYFSDKANVVRFPEIAYRMSYADVDFIPYPTKGYMAEILLRKKGFNDPVNLWQLTAKGSGTWPVSEKYFVNLRAVGMLKLPLRQPYMTKQFIGYEDQYLQGYEYYVIDGVAGGYGKASLTRQVLNTQIRIPSGRIKCLNHIPIKIFAKTFVNAGYVYSMHPGQNRLTNTMLYSGGIGLDILAFADFVIKLEWSFNRLGENGLYLHQRNYF